MENQTIQNQNLGGQVPVPNATAVLVLGIVSIALCWCYGVVGLACGIIALILSNKGKALYEASPEAYTLSSFNNLKAGRICGIIGLILSALTLVWVVVYVLILGAAFTTMPWQSF